MQSQSLVIIHHPLIERWILLKSACGILVVIGWLMSKGVLSVDDIMGTLLATFVRFGLDYWVKCENEHTVRFDWSASDHRSWFWCFRSEPLKLLHFLIEPDRDGGDL